MTVMAKVMFEVFSLLLNVDVVEEEGVSSIPAKQTNQRDRQSNYPSEKWLSTNNVVLIKFALLVLPTGTKPPSIG